VAEVRRRFEDDDRLFWHDASVRKPIVDFCVYTKNRVWRLPLSSKLGGDPTPLTFEAEGLSLVDAFVTVPPTDDDVVLTEADVVRVWPAEKNTSGRSRRGPTPLAPSNAMIGELTKMLRERCGDATS
jgi:hypothetical protein